MYVGDLDEVADHHLAEGDALALLLVNGGKGIPCGLGQCNWHHGATYMGQWMDGRPHGIGEETMRSGEAYFGEWIDGRNQHAACMHRSLFGADSNNARRNALRGRALDLGGQEDDLLR